MINPYNRYQKGLKVEFLFPKRNDNKCACGCENHLPPKKRRWYSKDCLKKSLNHFFIIKGDVSIIRSELYKVDNGYCRHCGVYDDKWQADHILAVVNGGGGCTIENFQTLCEHCHKIKTQIDLNH